MSSAGDHLQHMALMVYASSWLRRRAAPLVRLMLSCLARSTIALRFTVDTLCAISPAYFLRVCLYLWAVQ